MEPRMPLVMTKCLLRNLAIILALLGSAVAASSGYAVLYRFQNRGDGSIPIYGLVSDQAGNLYGVTSGSNSYSTVFELSPPATPGDPWVEATLYTFSDVNAGWCPSSGVAFNNAGNLYGTASCGGAFGGGVVYELSPPEKPGQSWTESVLYSFQNSYGRGDGFRPYGVIEDSSGNLYGETISGGAFDYGTIFQLAPPSAPGGSWTETILHSFNYQDGFQPSGGMLLSGRALFGVASGGNPVCGTYDCGLVFKLNPPDNPGASWRLQIIYEFTGGNDGSGPQGLITDGLGNLYGAAVNDGTWGSGTVFQLTPPPAPGSPWTETTLYNFNGTDGASPIGELIRDKTGNFFGVTWNGGPADIGTVYRLSPPPLSGGVWTETVLRSFQYALNGYLPNGVNFGRRGLLYGTTESGGSPGVPANGVVFMLKP
jgi:uncharacterized repeat protein (TIGR03803 family)